MATEFSIENAPLTNMLAKGLCYKKRQQNCFNHRACQMDSNPLSDLKCDTLEKISKGEL